jgi:hypothetical protein
MPGQPPLLCQPDAPQQSAKRGLAREKIYSKKNWLMFKTCAACALSQYRAR